MRGLRHLRRPAPCVLLALLARAIRLRSRSADLLFANAIVLELREQLREQLNAIMKTTDSARGLIVSMTGLLFETGKSTLVPNVRENLARVAGILLGHPGLEIEVEGHTDSVGSDAMNQSLSENRAEAVRQYLLAQGVPKDAIVSRGFGEMMPLATNDTAEGKAQNRRVEIVVSGQPIGDDAR